MISYLTRGSYGAIYTLDEETVLKQSIVDEEDFHVSFREIDIVRRLSSHPGFVTIKDIAFSPPGTLPKVILRDGERLDNTFLRMERAQGDLRDYVLKNGPLPIDKIRNLATQLLSALHYLHSKGFLHLDIHPSNVLIFDNGERFAFCDLGMAVPITRSLSLEEKFRPYPYHSPEMLLKKNIGEPTDVWSLGCLFAYVATGKHIMEPYFTLENPEKIIMRIDRDLEDSIQRKVGDPTLRSFLYSMLTLNPAKRSTVEELLRSEFVGLSECPCLGSSPNVDRILPRISREVIERMRLLEHRFKWKGWFSYKSLFMGLDLYLRLREHYQQVEVMDICWYIALKYYLLSLSAPSFQSINREIENVSSKAREIEEYVILSLDSVYRSHLESFFDQNGKVVDRSLFPYVLKYLGDPNRRYSEIYALVINDQQDKP